MTSTTRSTVWGFAPPEAAGMVIVTRSYASTLRTRVSATAGPDAASNVIDQVTAVIAAPNSRRSPPPCPNRSTASCVVDRRVWRADGACARRSPHCVPPMADTRRHDRRVDPPFRTDDCSCASWSRRQLVPLGGSLRGECGVCPALYRVRLQRRAAHSTCFSRLLSDRIASRPWMRRRSSDRLARRRAFPSVN